MTEQLQEIPVPILVTIIAVGAWFIKFVIEKAWESHTKSKDKESDSTDKQDAAIQSLTHAIIELRTEIKNLKEVIIDVVAEGRRSRSDINALFQKMRDLESDSRT